jgi:hypothetical protein
MSIARTLSFFVAALSTCLGQSSSPGLLSLLTPDEFRGAGLSKLTPAELQSLNAALIRVFVEIGKETPQSSLRPLSENRAGNTTEFFDSKGAAIAYFDDDETLYLWSGEPVAYVAEDSLFGFNGNHLGWRKDGMIYDHDGYVVAAISGMFKTPVALAPFKGLKKLKPLKSLKELKPLKPIFVSSWSGNPAQSFFLQGIR